MVTFIPETPRCRWCGGACGTGRDTFGRLVALCTSCGHQRVLRERERTEPREPAGRVPERAWWWTER